MSLRRGKPSQYVFAHDRRASRSLRRRLRWTATLGAAALALTACTTSTTPGAGSDAGSETGGSNSETGGSADTGSSSGGTFTIGIGVDLDTVDPAQQTTTTVQNVVDYGVQELTKLSPKGEVQPALATSWKYSDSGDAITFKLRKGVKFHDGTSFNAKAVKFNLDRIRDPKVKVPLGATFHVITKVEIVDPHTVRLHLKHPTPTLVRALAGTVAGMLSPASMSKHGNSYKNVVHPVGTGPYAFQSFQSGTKAVYTRVDDYWGKKPYYDKVVFLIIPEGNAREAALRSGQADMIMNPPVTDIKALESSAEVDVLKAPSDRSVFIAFNTSKPPFNNKKVRQALNYAVNKKALAENVLFGTVNIMDSPLSDTLAGYCKTGFYKYNPDKAKKMLAQAGAENLSITFGTPHGRYLQDKQVAEAIASGLSDIGVKAKVRTTDWPTYVSNMLAKNGPYDMHLLGWAPTALAATGQFEMFEKATVPPKGLNTSRYWSPKVEKLLSQARQELNEKKRNDLYCQAQKAVWNDAPWIFLWSQTLILAYSHDVAGISYIPNEKFNTIYAHPRQ